MNKQIKTQVKVILQQSESARNSDAVLVIELYKTFYHMPDPVRLEKLREIMAYASPEDIARHRRRLNQKGEYLPTDPEVIKARRLKIDDIKEDLGYRPSPQPERAEWWKN